MLDIKFVRANPDAVKENIKKKFQDEKIPMVDEVIEFDAKYRAAKTRCDELRAQRNKKSKEIGGLMAKGQKDEAEKVKAEVKAMADEMTRLEEDEKVFAEEVKNRMMVIPNIIDPSVPIGKDDSENVENERFGEPVVPDFEVPYHVDIMEKLNGIDIDAARDTSGNGFYYLCGDIDAIHGSVNQLADYGIEVEDTVAARLHFANGANGVFFATNCDYTNESVQIKVACEKASFLIEDDALFRIDADGVRTKLCENEKLPGAKFYFGASHGILINKFYRAIENNTDDYIHVRDAEMSIRLIDAIHASSKAGHPVAP